MIRFCNYFISGFILLLLTSSFGYGQTQQNYFKELYDSYLTAAKEGNMDKIISFYTKDVQKEMKGHLKSKADRKDFFSFYKSQLPESYEIVHMSYGADSQTVILNAIMQFDAMKEIQRERMRAESEIHFKKENDQWKLEEVMFLMDPDKITRPYDLTYKPEDADLDKEGNVGGRIISVDFKPGYTVVIIRVLDEEDAVFLPGEEELVKNGMSVKELVPWNVFEFLGHPHKTDKLKFFATSGNPVGR